MTIDPGVSPAFLDRAVGALQGMAYAHRLHILVVLRADEATPSELAAVVPAAPTAISHHLRQLVDAGLVRRQRRGRQVFYSLPNDSTRRLIDEVLRFAGP